MERCKIVGEEFVGSAIVTSPNALAAEPSLALHDSGNKVVDFKFIGELPPLDVCVWFCIGVGVI